MSPRSCGTTTSPIRLFPRNFCRTRCSRCSTPEIQPSWRYFLTPPAPLTRRWKRSVRFAQLPEKSVWCPAFPLWSPTLRSSANARNPSTSRSRSCLLLLPCCCSWTTGSSRSSFWRASASRSCSIWAPTTFWARYPTSPRRCPQCYSLPSRWTIPSSSGTATANTRRTFPTTRKPWRWRSRTPSLRWSAVPSPPSPALSRCAS